VCRTRERKTFRFIPTLKGKLTGGQDWSFFSLEARRKKARGEIDSRYLRVGREGSLRGGALRRGVKSTEGRYRRDSDRPVEKRKVSPEM